MSARVLANVIAQKGARAAQSVEASAGPQLDASTPGAASFSSGRAAGARTVVVVSADTALRQRLAERLAGLRWRVREASGGALAMMHLEAMPAEAMLVDSWLPDLEVASSRDTCACSIRTSSC
jgi:hypothetical protein